MDCFSDIYGKLMGETISKEGSSVKMKRQLFHNIKSAFLSRGVAISNAPARSDLAELLRMMAPKNVAGLNLVRAGGDNDGGYLIPDDLDGISACLSPGVDLIATFEAQLAARGIPSHLVDYSVSEPPSEINPASFTRKFLGATTNGNIVTLADWMNDVLPEEAEDLILQIDIEGAEYETLLAAPPEVLDRFRIIVIELHNLGSLGDRSFYRLFSAFMQKLTANHHVVHAHPNNVRPPISVRGLQIPPLIELTLWRNDRFDADAPHGPTILPHPLDQANLTDRPDFNLSRDWQRA